MKKKVVMFLCLVWSFMIIGCSNKDLGIATKIYYVDTSGNALITQEYFRKEDTSEAAVLELLQVMQNPTEIKEMQSAIPESVEVESVELQNRNLDIVFSESYSKLSKSAELLLRAAVVQTVVQVSNVDYVSFYIENEPIEDSAGNAIGYMSAEDFVQNTGSSLKSYQETDLKLYFADKDGTQLVKEERSGVRYNINTSIEKLVVEQLMKGPSTDKKKATIPNTVKLLGVSVKDGVCYVNFDAAFLTEGYNQKPEVTIYSIVNSIVANGKASRVQILVEGSGEEKFKGAIDLSIPLGWNANLVEE